MIKKWDKRQWAQKSSRYIPKQAEKPTQETHLESQRRLERQRDQDGDIPCDFCEAAGNCTGTSTALSAMQPTFPVFSLTDVPSSTNQLRSLSGQDST